MATTKLPASVAYEKTRIRTGRGSTAVHVLRVDPRDPNIMIRPVIAGDIGSGKETTSVVATRYDALAGINGGFFAGSGAPLGMIVIDGELVSAPLPRRSVFGISRAGEPFIQAFEFQGRVHTMNNVSLWVSAVNRPPHAGAVAVYTPRYGPLTPHLQTAVIVRDGNVQQFASGRIMIPNRGYVLTVNQAEAELLTRHLTIGQQITIHFDFSPDMELISALGGGPRLVKAGEPFIPFVWEWFSSRIFASRAPRTAVGITEAGKLVFVTVDGGSRRNSGMTLGELARLMVSLGAREAMNLDGGGSATMVVGGRTVNEPSAGEERPVGSALLILRATANP
jgi:exopolysaccharide biosynthesis protein